MGEDWNVREIKRRVFAQVSCNEASRWRNGDLESLVNKEVFLGVAAVWM